MTDAAARALRRYERERAARLEAEAIAEQGLRDLYEMNQSLDARIKERTAELEAANEAKKNLLAHVGHELRTPLNGVAGMLELLDGVTTDGQAREWLTSAQASSDRLGRLVDRILRFVALEGVDLQRRNEVESVEAIVGRVESSWTAACARAGMLFITENRIGADVSVTQSDDLEVAIGELVSNAIVHADPGALSFVVSREGETVTFAIADSGPGIDGVSIAQASQPMVIAQGAATAADSRAGLGLALVERISVAMGGSSGAEPHDGGTRAWIKVPVR